MFRLAAPHPRRFACAPRPLFAAFRLLSSGGASVRARRGLVHPFAALAAQRRTRPMKLLAGSFAALFLSLSAQAADCTFTQLEIVPQFGSPNMFGGEDEHVRVMFSNEDPNDDNPDAFPEPPVYLADRDSGNDCRIEDGGIWSRGGVFLSQDGRRVLMHEFSGSSAGFGVLRQRHLQGGAPRGHLRPALGGGQGRAAPGSEMLGRIRRQLREGREAFARAVLPDRKEMIRAGAPLIDTHR